MTNGDNEKKIDQKGEEKVDVNACCCLVARRGEKSIVDLRPAMRSAMVVGAPKDTVCHSFEKDPSNNQLIQFRSVFSRVYLESTNQAFPFSCAHFDSAVTMMEKQQKSLVQTDPSRPSPLTLN
jgi:hypothetical protein